MSFSEDEASAWNALTDEDLFGGRSSSLCEVARFQFSKELDITFTNSLSLDISGNSRKVCYVVKYFCKIKI